MKFKTLFILTFFLNLSISNAKEYSLLNPVPKDKMRKMTTERPSVGDSPLTIDAGHFQLETSLYSYTKNKDAGAKTVTNSAFDSTAIRIGLSKNSEIQFIASPMIWQNSKDSSSRSNIKGFSDTTIRGKYNFTGNNGEDLAIAIIPYFSIPSNSDVSGGSNDIGVSFPISYNLGNDYSLDYQLGFDLAKRLGDSKRSFSYSNIIGLSKSFTDKFSGFVQYYYLQSEESIFARQRIFNFGASYTLKEDLMIDAAFNRGLSKYSDDFNMIFGFSYRY